MILPAIALIKYLPFVFAVDCGNKTRFFFFLPTWYKYLNLGPDCTPTVSGFNINDFWLIGLAVLDMLVRLAGFVAVISIIIAGIMYITATGEPEKAAAARKRLYNSLIGLAIALIATGLVAFLANTLT
ncbi:MAG TPA: hypothetical protein VLE51_00780 [Candidatus Saccharimonadales bacterium]|nr:hypothetical protein [Candidatus Saccharimonadales bacterium]